MKLYKDTQLRSRCLAWSVDGRRIVIRRWRGSMARIAPPPRPARLRVNLNGSITV